MRTAFFGTPAIAVPAFTALAETTEVVGVVCQPDRPAGRGLRVAEPPIKIAALSRDIEVHQPKKVKTGTVHRWLEERGVEAVIVMAYGRILPAAVLEAPRLGCINLHASLLPRYRGAAPINWAIVCGETETGISVMQMDEGMDTGPVFSTRSIPIGDSETAGQLAERLAELAARCVREDLPRVLSGKLSAAPQDDTRATMAPLIKREHTVIDWTRSPLEVKNLVRGMAPKPGAFSGVRGKKLKVLVSEPAPGGEALDGRPGEVVRAEGGDLWVCAGGGCAAILEAQLEGKRALGSRDLINGRALRVGDLLEAPGPC